jgi:hypothetical protein
MGRGRARAGSRPRNMHVQAKLSTSRFKLPKYLPYLSGVLLLASWMGGEGDVVERFLGC